MQERLNFEPSQLETEASQAYSDGESELSYESSTEGEYSEDDAQSQATITVHH